MTQELEEPKLKLYLWESVLWDYTPGVAFALAFDENQARRLIFEKKCPEELDLLDLENNEKGLEEHWFYRDLVKDPLVIEYPFGYSLSGGG